MSETVPWCDTCEAFAVPVEGTCGLCGEPIEYVETDP